MIFFQDVVAVIRVKRTPVRNGQYLIRMDVGAPAAVQGNKLFEKTLEAPDRNVGIGIPVVSGKVWIVAEGLFPLLKKWDEQGPDSIEPGRQRGSGQDRAQLDRVVEIVAVRIKNGREVSVSFGGQKVQLGHERSQACRKGQVQRRGRVPGGKAAREKAPRI